MPGYDVGRLQEIIARRRRLDGPLLPILHEVRHAFGHVSDEAVTVIAEALNLTGAEVHGVVTFYADFNREAPARRVLKLCVAEACQARGADAVATRLEQALGVGMGRARPDGSLSLAPVYCLGLCASGPAALLDDRPVARLEGERLAGLIAGIAG